MPHATISVEYMGRIIDMRSILLADGLVMGDVEGAVVSFPGGHVAVSKNHRGWRVGSRPLIAGSPVRVNFGDTSVSVELNERASLGYSPRSTGHTRIALATAALILMGVWFDAVRHHVRSNPELADGLVAALVGVDVPKAKAPQESPQPERQWSPPVRYVQAPR